ncbi:MAG: helix-turn-helix domain-containing protein [Reyranella sp.]|uniref:helix-turn-helix domain-containing protein n=1 Tax=Reyranella sp. TaxID=1929291 RepID=UPI0012253576|nr:helix-turn-helix transcriptional regulator [Reyranella sp.]TAJ87053.1 MAG: helix-turn-helix domain-containing protein [Reyranella sp.]TBR26953.1 MAG: helix-turn-helix domain-containing protein [Reyranella sp.]
MPDQVDWRAIEREAGPGQAVGRLLRDQREARGLDLTQVEKSIRIRRAHLEAIEDGRYDELPGAAYIPAFLRAYATHVGLDPEKVMTAYHLSGAVPIKRPVALPANFPVADRRAPIGLAVLTVLLVVGAGYGVWHYMPRDQAVVAQKVPPVPDRLLSERPSTPAPAPNPFVAQMPSSPAPETRTLSGSLPAQVWPAQRIEGSAPAAPLAPPPVVVAVPAPPPPVVMNVPSIGQAQAAQPPAPIEPPRLEPAKPVEEANARQPEATPPPMPVRVNTPISVKTNSWVELRAPNGDVLTQTYVRAGESYVVPAGIAYRITEAR